MVFALFSPDFLVEDGVHKKDVRSHLRGVQVVSLLTARAKRETECAQDMNATTDLSWVIF